MVMAMVAMVMEIMAMVMVKKKENLFSAGLKDLRE